MKKIGIITFHSPYNYGSSLQNYALQQVLKELGFEPETINLRTERQKEQYNYFKPIKDLIDKKRILLKIAYAPFKKELLQKYKLYEDFLSKELLLSKEVSSLDEVKKLPAYDGYIVGSDQCWNLNAKDFDWSYFLEFTPPNIPKISYAISMGPNPNSLIHSAADTKQRIANALDSFKAISTRDEKTAEIVRHFASKCPKIEILPDPTLLIPAKMWKQKIEETPIIPGKYIFLYNPYYIKEVYDSAKKLTKLTGLKVVVSNTNPQAMISAPFFENHLNVGPWEFLNMINNASYVIGRSFHLLVFSILFHKRCIAVEGLGDSRIANLLTITQLQKCATRGNNIEEVLEHIKEIDYSLADKILADKAEIARVFLKENL